MAMLVITRWYIYIYIYTVFPYNIDAAIDFLVGISLVALVPISSMRAGCPKLLTSGEFLVGPTWDTEKVLY